MRFRIYLYAIARILFGLVLTFNGAYNVIVYPKFLACLENHFERTSVLDFEFVEFFLVLVPFTEFTIGSLLMIGCYTRKVLISSVILFLFIVMYLLDANSEILIFVYAVFLLMSGILLRKDNYNLKSMDYSRDSYQMI
ncbi:MauE/DoxX family redox-associated membrane protein [uncultured Aquimarina sp.]|uniref:MauE/DoxX family redox-associated membrane protein n=1 Tax=uncultured Aquimarina sp. TaxID=575652 RepID=UPI0026392D74|nr:MauE/DoxX family redox-associated membrane protein [uncultured Aquimarina sp.]